MKQTKKQQHAAMIAEAIARANARGATEADNHNHYSLELATKHGALRLYFTSDYCDTGEIDAICRFDDPKAIRAFGLIHGNQFTGKWNHHGMDAAGLECLFKKMESFK